MTIGQQAAHSRRDRLRNPPGEGSRLRDELIAAAGRLLTAGGDPESLSLRAVAREAGIAAPSVYLQFDSKDALLQAVISEHFALFQRAVEAGFASESDPASRLLSGCLAYCHFAAEQPGSYRIIFETALPDWRHLATDELPGMDAFHVLVGGVAACIASGQARKGDPFLIATDIWITLHGMVSLRQHLPGFPWPPIEQQLIGLLHALTGIPFEKLLGNGETP